MIWYDMIWYDMIWYDMIWYNMIWYDVTFIRLMSPGQSSWASSYPVYKGISHNLILSHFWKGLDFTARVYSLELKHLLCFNISLHKKAVLTHPLSKCIDLSSGNLGKTPILHDVGIRIFFKSAFKWNQVGILGKTLLFIYCFETRSWNWLFSFVFTQF